MPPIVAERAAAQHPQRGLLTLVGAAALALAVSSAAGQGPELPDRPRIGLVLSGGGARGIAHVGVLKVLEELRVPVDLVTGTSMGAVVGGLFAAGLSPAEIEEVLTETDWNDVLDDRPDRRRLPFRRKVDDLTLQTRFEFGFSGGKFRTPSGLVPGHKLGVELRSLTLHTSGIDDFDELPLPFRAVATDIATGEMVILDHGNLADAIRASMAVPGVFAPVEIEGRSLVDGGVVRNLPVDVARAMGAEIIIAVDVGELLASKDLQPTMTGVLAQLRNLMTRTNVEPLLSQIEVLVRPDLEDFKGASFGRAAEIAAQGEEAAWCKVAELSALAVSEEEYARHLARTRRRPAELRISSIQVSSTTEIDPRRIFRRVRTRPDTVLDLATVRRDLTRLYELGEFEAVDFRLYPDGEEYGLIIDTRPKSWGPNYLRFGINLVSDVESSGEFDLVGSYTMTHLNHLEAEWKTLVRVGERPFLSSELYQPLEHSGTYFAFARVEGESNEEPVFGPGAGQPVAAYDVRIFKGTLGFGVSFGRFGEIRLGLSRGYGKGEPLIAGSEFEDVRVEQGAFEVEAIIDQFDSVSFPKNGLLAVLELISARQKIAGDFQYDRLLSYLWLARSFGRHTLLTRIEFASALGSELPLHDQHELGGLFRLSGLTSGEIHGQYGGVAALAYLYRLGRLPVFGEGFYLGASLEAGNLWQTSAAVSSDDLRWAGSVLAGADTVVGPIYFAYGRADGGRDAFYFLVGNSF